jgi:hypothetical protein
MSLFLSFYMSSSGEDIAAVAPPEALPWLFLLPPSYGELPLQQVTFLLGAVVATSHIVATRVELM